MSSRNRSSVFVTPDRLREYGRFAGDPTDEQLARFFFLTAEDLAQVDRCRGDHNRVGYAVQLCSVRFLGRFEPDLRRTPPAVRYHVGEQLGIAVESGHLERYQASQTRRRHREAIGRANGYRSFGDPAARLAFVRWLLRRVWSSPERPSVVFDRATAWLVANRVLLPGAFELARHVQAARNRVAERTWRILGELVDSERAAQVEGLLERGAENEHSTLEQLRRGPTKATAATLLECIVRLDTARGLAVDDVAADVIPPARMRELVRYAETARAHTIGRLREPQRTAVLVAFLATLRPRVEDEVLDVFDALMYKLHSSADQRTMQERHQARRRLDRALRDVVAACAVVLDPKVRDEDLRRRVFCRVPEERLVESWTHVQHETNRREGGELRHFCRRYPYVRSFLPALLDALDLRAIGRGGSVLDAVHYLRRIEGRPRADLSRAPMGHLDSRWRRYFEHTEVNRAAYVMSVADALRQGLRRRDVYIACGDRWGDPRRQLIPQANWSRQRDRFCAATGRPHAGTEALSRIAEELDVAWRRARAAIKPGGPIRLEVNEGCARFVVSPVDRCEIGPGLVFLRQEVQRRIPRLELPELLMDVAQWTRFTDAFHPIGGARSRADGMSVSICAALLVDACNIDLRPVVKDEEAALSARRLDWVRQAYVRAETLAAANVALVDAQAESPVAALWGAGEVASAAGLRFGVVGNTLSAHWNRRYFGRQRGITYLNYMTDQYSQFHGLVIPGTLRDSIYVLDGLLENQSAIKPRELITDTAGYSELVFGLFWLLGLRFSPRLRDLGHVRMYRMGSVSDYGELNAVARWAVRRERIVDHWDDMLRVAASLLEGTVSASALMRTLRPTGPRTGLGRGIAELGRIARTQHILQYVADPAFRRRVRVQRNRTEARHSLARAVFYGRRGKVQQAYREGQEDQLGALGLVLNCIVLWNTRYIQAVIDRLREEGARVDDRDVARLSPLIHGHINLVGRYEFDRSLAAPPRGLRPLRA